LKSQIFLKIKNLAMRSDFSLMTKTSYLLNYLAGDDEVSLLEAVSGVDGATLISRFVDISMFSLFVL